MSNGAFDARDLVARAAFSMAGASTDAGVAAVLESRGRDVPVHPCRKAGRPRSSAQRGLGREIFGGGVRPSDRDDEAAPHYQRALELDERRYVRDPQNRSAQFDLAIDLSNMAVIAEGHDKLDEAYSLLSRSLELRQKLSDSDPTDALTKGRVGYVHLRLARLDIKRARYSFALAHAREGIRIQESIVATTGDAESRRDLGGALHAMALSLAGTGDHATACAVARRSLQMFDGDSGDRASLYYYNRAKAEVALCDAGKHIDPSKFLDSGS